MQRRKIKLNSVGELADPSSNMDSGNKEDSKVEPHICTHVHTCIYAMHQKVSVHIAA